MNTNPAAVALLADHDLVDHLAQLRAALMTQLADVAPEFHRADDAWLLTVIRMYTAELERRAARARAVRTLEAVLTA
ncbi:hypothetical protein [Singulisphaera sp. PoT]|uniref:hypothetical protein n=1 Tax=Singulisphaera sp. PoT TaxID=3411797 RepID=UPI003BF61729